MNTEVEIAAADAQEGDLRQELAAAAHRLGSAAKYRSAGTVEFLVDDDTAKFYFLEVNTRLQVQCAVLRSSCKPTDCIIF